MPGGKTKKTSAPKKTKTAQTSLKELKSMVRSEEALMKTELNYFKGLSITITVLIVCVFFAFGSLFTAMYLETKAMNAILIDYLNGEVEVMMETDAQADSDQVTESAEIEWLSFGKYGITMYFPNSWTFLDKPYEKELHFYADGIVRLPGNGDVGDMYVQVLNQQEADDYLFSDRVVSKTQAFVIDDALAEKAMYQGDDGLNEFVMIRTADPTINYLIMFDTQEAMDIMAGVIEKIDLQ